MKCPNCSHPEDHVIDSRPVESANVIRRRRECLACASRFTTYERCETIPMAVIKSDNRREPFDRNKLRSGILLACKKRNISAEQIEKIVFDVELQLQEEYVLEVPSRIIGNKISAILKTLDSVAYIRYVSVYRNFSDTDEFLHEVKDLQNTRKTKKKKVKGLPQSISVELPAWSKN